MPQPGTARHRSLKLRPLTFPAPSDFTRSVIRSGGHAACLGILLAAGAPIEPRCCTGDTPLHLAARGRNRGHEECLRQLLAHGADPTATNRNGKVAADLAHGDMVQLLRAHSPPPRPTSVYAIVELPDGARACIDLGPGGSLPSILDDSKESDPANCGWNDAVEAFTGFSSARGSRRRSDRQRVNV